MDLKTFLPQSDKIITCHNIGNKFSEEKEIGDLKNKEKIIIGFVGGVRYFDENCKFIQILLIIQNINYIILVKEIWIAI